MLSVQGGKMVITGSAQCAVWSNGCNMTVEERDALFIGAEPNNSGGNEDCTALYLNDALNDAWCDGKFGYACEIPI